MQKLATIASGAVLPRKEAGRIARTVARRKEEEICMKACSLTCVIGYGAMICFGFLAITGAADDPSRVVLINELLAAAGFAAGTTSWLRLQRAT